MDSLRSRIDRRFLRCTQDKPLLWLAGAIALAVLAGLYGIAIGGLGDRKLALVLFLVPAFLVVMMLRSAPRLLFSLLTVSLSFSARFRFAGQGFHPGGAELALAPLDFALLPLALFWLLRTAGQRNVTLRFPRFLSWALALFVIAHGLAIIPASDRGLAFLELLRLFKMLLLVLIVSQVASSRRVLTATVSLLLILVICQGILAVFQGVFHTSLGLDFLGEHQYWTISQGGISIGRAGGTLGHANVLANFFEVLTPVGFALLLSGVNGRFRWLASGALLAGIVGTTLTSSRAGWAALAIGLLLVGWQYRRRLLRKRTFLVLLVTATLLLGMGLVFRDTIAARFTTFWEGSRIVRSVTAETAMRMVRAHPVLGVGANNYLEVSTGYVDLPEDSGLFTVAAAVVHNLLLLYAAEFGLVGLASFLLLLWSVVRLGRWVQRSRDPWIAAVSGGIVAGLAALVAHGMWDWLFRYDPVFTLFWFQVALLVACYGVARGRTSYQGLQQP